MGAANRPKISFEDLSLNFREINPELTKQEAIEEANRCLYCYDAPCIKACPTGIDIPTFIKKIASGNLKGSAKTIISANPIGASCARVCPTEELCEGACVLNHSTKPIMIGNLQRYATDWAIKNEQTLFEPGKKNGKSLRLLAEGQPVYLQRRNWRCWAMMSRYLKQKKKAGGLNTYGIVSFRFPQNISYWEVKQIESLDVKFEQIQV